MPQISEQKFKELHRQIKKGDILHLRHELDGGLDPNSKNRFGWTLLMLVALEGRKDMLDLLVSRGADARLENDFGFTAEILARSKEHAKAAAFLAKHAAKKTEARV